MWNLEQLREKKLLIYHVLKLLLLTLVESYSADFQMKDTTLYEESDV